MAYKDKIYDIAALEMFKRLTVFLDEKLGRKRVREEKMTVEQKIDSFCGDRVASVRERMHSIRRVRNSIVHPPDEDKHVRFCPHPVPVLDLAAFGKFHNDCFALNEYYPELRMNEVLIPTLEYPMGNGGDIIKHGMLAEFVQWYKSADGGNGVLRFADSFGGSPWGNMSDDLWPRLTKLKGCALLNAYPKGADVYLGSSHLVRQAAEKCGLRAEIDISDGNEAARYNLEISVSEHGFMKLIELPPDNDGYEILCDNRAANYDLILIDPYSKFLRDEFYKNNGKHFPRIRKLVDANPNLFVAVFVLDMDHENEVGKGFAEFKRCELAGCTFSIRYPKRMPKDGNRFNSEILLIGKQIADGKCGGLYKRLREFTAKAAKVLPLSDGKKLELWGAGQTTPDNPKEFSGE